MEDPQRVCMDAGVPLPDAPSTVPVVSAPAGKGSGECQICRESLRKSRVTSLACAHAFCDTCWSTYLALRIQEGDTCIRCPQHKCPLNVPEEVVVSLCTPEIALRFKDFMRKSFVDDSRSATWCPHPGCTLAVDTDTAVGVGGDDDGGHGGLGQFVTCGAGHAFCARCKRPEVHAPAPCDLVRSWQKKCDDDSETMNWLSVHTQDCPQCKSTIEKNGGCNHMTCRSCKHEFCWVCGGPWAKHGSNYYNCSTFNADTTKDKESNKAASRSALERYLHHFTRYMNHDASIKLEAKTRQRAEDTIRALQEKNPDSAQWSDVSFVQRGVECAIQCRTVLKWTYVLAFYLEDKAPEKELFCFMQADLESRTERLSELLEKPVETLIENKAEILALAGAASNARQKLLKGAPPVDAAVAAAAGEAAPAAAGA